MRAKQFRVPVSTTFCNYFIEKISIQIIHQNKKRKKTERKTERQKKRNKEREKQRSKKTKKQTKKQKKIVYIKYHVHPFATQAIAKQDLKV